MTTEATSRTPDEVALLAWFCTHLPELAESADRHGWAHRLHAMVADVRQGAPVGEAGSRHRIPVDVAAAAGEQALISRGELSVLAGLGIDPVEVIGAYRCPARPPCSRRADRDQRGREPRCGVVDRPMTLGAAGS